MDLFGDLGGSKDFALQNPFLSALLGIRIINYSDTLVSLKGRTLFASLPEISKLKKNPFRIRF